MPQCNNVGCGKVFDWRQQLKRHQSNCKFPKPKSKYEKRDGKFICSTCNKVFNHQSGVSKHIKKEKCLKNEQQQFDCPKCPRSFHYKCRFTAHLKMHEVELRCSTCLRLFKRKDFYSKHVIECVPDNDFIPSFAEPTVFEGVVEDEVTYDSDSDNFDFSVNNGVSVDDSVLVDEENVESDEVNEHDANVEVNAVNPDRSFFNDENVQVPVSVEDRLFLNDENVDVLVSIEDTLLINEENVEIDDVDDNDENVEINSLSVDDIFLMDEENDEMVSDLNHNSNSGRWKEYKLVQRKKERLEDIVNNLNSPVKNKVVKTFIKGNRKSLEEIMAYTSCENQYEAEMNNLVVERLKKLIQGKKFSDFYTMFDQFFGKRTDDNAFMSWLVGQKLGIRVKRFMARYKEWQDRDFKDSRGRKKLSPEIVQKVYDIYVENSISSTDGRNGRNMITLSKRRFIETYGYEVEHKDIKLEKKTRRNKDVYCSNRRIATCTVRAVQKKIEEDDGINISIGKLLALKPFFITYPTDKELALCLCKLCLNSKLLLEVLVAQGKKDNDSISGSVTEFYMESATCNKTENGYYHWKCSSGKCNDCKKLKPLELKCSTSTNKVKVGQFEVTKTPYTKTNEETGESVTKISKKCEKVIVDRTYADVYSTLSNWKVKYMMHKYQVYNDKFHWKKILTTVGDGPIYHMDYSENLTQSYKYEPQSSHFNKRQFSLHCTVKHALDGALSYLYHFSDDKKHDFAFTSKVIRHLIELDEDGLTDLVRIKSDNCSTQYKCRFVFHFYHEFAMSSGLTVLVYFGVSGHGKGLVDAMSAFGAKTPLRRAIITENFDYTCADDIRVYLDRLFQDDQKKSYFTVGIDDLLHIRESKQPFPIKGCQAQHMFSFFPNGEVQCKVNICSCENCLTGNFIKCRSEAGKVVQRGDDSDYTDDSDECDDGADVINDIDYDAIELRGDTILGAIVTGSIVGILTDKESNKRETDPFFLCLVNSFGIAENPLGDKNNFIAAGEKYIEGQYLKKNEKKRKYLGKVHYDLLKETVYINPATVFFPCVNMDSQYTMTIDEWIWLCDAVNRTDS